MEYEINNNLMEQNYEDYCLTKRKLENLTSVRTRGHIIRSKARYVEEGEKNSKYFLNLEKRNYNVKHIKSLLVNNTKVINKPKRHIARRKILLPETL